MGESIPWNVFKMFLDSKSVPAEWADFGDMYYLLATSGHLKFTCALAKTDAAEFEANYKA